MTVKKITGDPNTPIGKAKPKRDVTPKEVKLTLGRDDVERLKKKWPWADDSIDEIETRQVVEYLKPAERIHFVNEMCRVMKKGAKAYITCPYWASNMSMADLAIEWPPIAEGWFYHLDPVWRKANNSQEKRYTCTFNATWGYGLHPSILTKNQEYQQHAVSFWKEAAQVLSATLIKK